MSRVSFVYAAGAGAGCGECAIWERVHDESAGSVRVVAAVVVVDSCVCLSGSSCPPLPLLHISILHDVRRLHFAHSERVSTFIAARGR